MIGTFCTTLCTWRYCVLPSMTSGINTTPVNSFNIIFIEYINGSDGYTSIHCILNACKMLQELKTSAIFYTLSTWNMIKPDILTLILYSICNSGGSIILILFLSYLVKYWRQGHRSIHLFKGNDTRNTPIVLDCCNNQRVFWENHKKRILIYCLEKRKQSIKCITSFLNSLPNI